MPSSSPPAIAVLGSVNADVTGFCDRLPRPGETISGSRYTITLGGKGANQAAAVARLGLRVEMIGSIGDDGFGTMTRTSLGALGVGLDHLLIAKGTNTGVALINVDAHAENSIVVIAGANATVGVDATDRAAPTLKEAPVLLIQLEIPLAAGLAAAAMVRDHGGLVILDPAPAPSGGLSSDVLSAVDIVTPNETETEALVGIRPENAVDAAKAAGVLRSRGVTTAVIKLGKRGAYFQGRDAEGFVPPFPVKAVNSVGAGDTFNGGLGVALARGYDLPRAVRFAAACGALATTGRGGAEAAPTLAAVEALLNS